MKILAIDTATEACSAALYIDGQIIEQYQLAPREHTKLILPMVESLLAEADIKLVDLNALAFGRGPGSFTGVRIATGVVQGLAFAADLPVIPISTLASIAQLTYEYHQCEKVLAGIDARMGEIYWGCFQLNENKLMTQISEEQVSKADKLKLPGSDTDSWCAAGSAWGSYAQVLQEQLGNRIVQTYGDYFPSAGTIAKLASVEQGVEASQAQPVYLRNDVAKKKADQPVKK